MRRPLLLVAAVVLVGCGGGPTGTTGASIDTGTSPTSWTLDDSGGPCDPATLPDPVDPFAHVPYTLDLPPAWLALPPTCVTPVSEYFLVPIPGDESSRLLVWPRAPSPAPTREQSYAEIEAFAASPLPSGMAAWVIPPTVRRVDLPIGPALEITYTAPATDRQPTPRQALQYSVWIDGDVFSFDLTAEPDQFAELEPGFREIAQTIRLKATTSRLGLPPAVHL
jgi:hypothetical protein